MTRTLSEKKVLKALDIPDFRHMTKDKVVEFASMLPRMDPEVAKAALAQFPEYAQTMKDLAQTYREEVSEAATSNETQLKPGDGETWGRFRVPLRAVPLNDSGFPRTQSMHITHSK